MSLTVEALVPAVGITGLDPDSSSGWPQMQGLKSKTIGTNPRYSKTITVQEGQLALNNGRLATSLAALVNASQIRVSDGAGNVLTADDLTGTKLMGTTPQQGQAPQIPLAGNTFAVSGTWTLSYDNLVADGFDLTRTAAAAVEQVVLNIPTSDLKDATGAGRKPVGFVLIYMIDTADVNDVTVDVFKTAIPADGSAPVPTTLSTGQTYDDAHNTAGERGDSTGAPEQHTLEVTFDPDLAAVAFLNEGETLHALVSVDGTAGGVLSILGWSLKFEENAQ